MTAGTNYLQIPGALVSNEWHSDTFCGGKLSNFVNDPSQNADALGASVHSTVIGNYEVLSLVFKTLVQ